MNSVQTTEKIILKKDESKKLLTFKVTRGINGVEIFLQSDILEQFFQRYGSEAGENKWCGHQPYQIPIVRQHFRELLNQWYGELTTRNGSYPNLSMLRSKGLSEGVKFTMNNNVYTKPEILSFIKQFKTEVQNFFEEYIKPISLEVELVCTIRGEDALE